MKIKLAVLDSDINYQNRFIATFNAKYADKFEIYSFTDAEVAISTIESARINVLIASDLFDIDVTSLPDYCAFAYFVNTMGVDSYKDQPAICKFQKSDLIYKQILSCYSEKAGSVSQLKLDDAKTNIIAFCSPAGGTGTSTVAAGCATYFARQGKKALYLNLEKFGSSDNFFSAEGLYDMSDIIFALKMKKTNVAMKLESCVKQDASGVYFYSQPKIALDMCSLTESEILSLINEINVYGEYDYIILDLDFEFNDSSIKVLQESGVIVFVTDGSETANSKTERAFTAIATKYADDVVPLAAKIVLAYNKFSNKTGKPINIDGVKSLGGAPRYEHATTAQIIEQLCNTHIYEQLG